MGNIAKGYKGTLPICFEETFGEKPATPVVFVMPVNTNSLKMSQNQTAPATLTGRRDAVAPILGNVDVSGDADVPLDEEYLGLWLRAMFGNPTTTGTVEPYSHAFKIADSMPSMMMETPVPDVPSYMQYNGNKISKATFKFGGDAEMTVGLTIMGAKGAESSTSIAVTPKKLIFKRFQAFQAALTIDGKPFKDALEGSIEFDFGLDGDTYCVGGNGTRRDIVEGLTAISGSVTAFFTDKSLLDLMLTNKKTSLALKWTSGTHSFEIKLPEIQFPKDAPTIEGPKGVKINGAKFNAFYESDAGNSSALLTLVNAVKSYTTFTVPEEKPEIKEQK